MTDKTIIYESLKQTDYLPDWVDKLNETNDKLRDAILSLYNNLRLDTDNKSIGGTTYDEVINSVNSEIFNVYSKNSDGGIFFHSLNNGNVSNRVAYIKETETGNFEARFNNLILDENLTVEGDFTLGSEGSENSLTVVGPVEIKGNLATTPGFVNADALSNNTLQISGLSNAIYFINLGEQINNDLNLTIEFMDDVATPAQKFPVKQGASFRFIAGQFADYLPVGKKLTISFANAEIVNGEKDTFELGEKDYGKEIDVLVVGDAVGTASGYKIFVEEK